MFQKFNSDIGWGPKYPYSGLYVITKPPNKNWSVLFARKAMGGDSINNYVGERFKVGHKYNRNNKRVDAFGKKSGAAGTDMKYWGKWVSIGGKNDRKAKNNFEAALNEFKDETASDSSISRHLHFIYSFVSNNTLIYVAYLPYKYATRLNTRKGTNRDLIFSSKGEIAELRWIEYNNVYNRNYMKNGVANYVLKSYDKYVYSFINSLK